MKKNQPSIENPCSPAPDLPPEMMEEILQYLPLKDILSCRLVWKDHDAIMKEFIGKKMKPILFNVKNEGLRDHLKNNPNSPVPNALHLEMTFEEDHETIKEICKNLKGKVKHLKVDMNKDYAEDGETQKMIKDRIRRRTQQFSTANARLLVHILETLGGSLQTLKFGLFKPEFYQIANGLARRSRSCSCVAGNFNLPSLKKISIFGEPQGGKSASEKISLWNQLIFKSCGKLKSIKISVSSNEVNVLKDLKEVGRLTQITSLELHQVDEGQNLDVLLEYESCGGLQIEALQILRFPRKDEDEGRLERVLIMQSKKLKSFLVIDHLLTNLKLPVMEQLTSLSLVESGTQNRLENICLEKITPNLKQFTLLKLKPQGSEKLILYVTARSCKTLHTMFMRGNATLLGVGACEILAKTLPFITTLILDNPSDEFLQKLGTVWPNLTTLSLKLPKEFKDLDKSLFGITPEWKKSVDKNVDQWWTLNQPPPDSQIDSICSLTKLQVLQIHREITPFCRRVTRSNMGGIESNFSEFSYFYGLKNLKNLEVFSISQGSSVTHEEEISDEARNFIRRKLPELQIDCGSLKHWSHGVIYEFSCSIKSNE